MVMQWRRVRLGAIMRAISLRGWKCSPGHHYLRLVDRSGGMYDFTLHPPRIRKIIYET